VSPLARRVFAVCRVAQVTQSSATLLGREGESFLRLAKKVAPVRANWGILRKEVGIGGRK